VAARSARAATDDAGDRLSWRRFSGPAFFAYADNYLIDVKFGVIMDVEASRAIRQAEVGTAKVMIERTEERFGIKAEYLAADIWPCVGSR
jgi:hypothetical protein